MKIYKTKHRHPWVIMKEAIQTYEKGKKSFRQISDSFKKKGIDVSHKTISLWVKSFKEEVKKPTIEIENLRKR